MTPRLTLAEIDQLPALLAVKDLARVFGVSVSRAHKLDREGAFDWLLTKPAIGPLKFSAEKLRRFVAGEDVRSLRRAG